jgi:hypothetical protein
LERYYLIIYFKGESDNFTKTWEEYKKDFNSCEFPIDKKPLKSEDVFVMLDKDFDNTTGFLIAKTCHDNFEMFHIMVNFSIGDVCA